MKNMKTKSMVAMACVGSCAYLGYKYMKDHPEVKKNMKNMAKSATKKIYQKLDDMDID